MIGVRGDGAGAAAAPTDHKVDNGPLVEHIVEPGEAKAGQARTQRRSAALKAAE